MRTRAALVAIATVGAVVLAACAPGTPDLAYSPSGSVQYGPGTSGIAEKQELVPTADGGVLATGGSRVLTRIGPDGVVDASWGAGLPVALACTTTGRAVAAGSSTLLTCSHNVNGALIWQVARVTRAGELDPTFDGDGVVGLSPLINAVDVAPLPGGGVLAVGHRELPPSKTEVPPLLVTVLSSTGAVVSTATITIVPPIAQLPDAFEGWHISAVLVPTATGVTAFERESAPTVSGNLEGVLTRVQHFGADGTALDDPAWKNPPSPGIVGGWAIPGFVVLPDGRAVVAAKLFTLDIQIGTQTTISYLQMLKTDGTPDPSFGNGGLVNLTTRDGARLDPTALVVSADGRHLVVAGAPEGGPVQVARYLVADGSLDTSYGDGGRAGVTLDRIDAMAPRTGVAQLYLGGRDQQDRFAVARIWDQVTG